MNGLAKPVFIPVCCVCGLAREEGSSDGHSDELWSDFDTYVDRHELRGADYKLTHAYCPTCAQLVTVKKKPMITEEGRSPDERVTITEVIMETLRKEMRCELDALVDACPQYSWNQIFLEVDRLSRNGDIQLIPWERGHYRVSLAERSASNQGSTERSLYV